MVQRHFELSTCAAIDTDVVIFHDGDDDDDSDDDDDEDVCVCNRGLWLSLANILIVHGMF